MTQASSLEFVHLGRGALAVTHRPKVKLLPAMRAAGVTHLVTLLSRREGALMVGTAAKAAGLEWIWVEIANGRQPPPACRHEIVAALTMLAELLDDGAEVVIHCSAGIHRTGMFTYALLRTCGLDPDESMDVLARLRAATAAGVGAERLAWTEQLSKAARDRLDNPPQH
ncbi:protein-tyrosine phosphatase family protein [Nocardia iowensis]|uniref:Tyrosine-protein phosphatase n=1 Tax=Nocardia iowensis TaxID=204891 RepID=A0ABX8RTU1_NOCIO|nr:tyrosine-protein phosphatase [Nocardia iowensis]QXN93069.1 tyrosine-protein phosphatase [Nocardia iowensis]